MRVGSERALDGPRSNHNAEAPPATFRYLWAMRLWRAVVGGLVAAVLPLACSGKLDHATAAASGAAATGGAAGGSLNLGDAAVPPTGPCGSQTIPALTNPPNISFIVDHSASMGDEFAHTRLSKYENARLALSRVLKAVGHRINYGAAIFPGLDGVTGCEAGTELIKVAPGDAPRYAREGKTGPRLKDLLGRLSIAGVDGGTPVAPTLTKMLDVLGKLEGNTYVVLITDGAPNCNEELSCDASACIPNIEGLTVGGLDCTAPYNCCEPSPSDPEANRSCVDEDASLQAVRALRDAGIRTYVVGMPGSEPYENLLNAMADVGGTAREGELKYYSVADTEALEQSLKAIAVSLAISCDIPLDYEPPEPDYVNVYFDGDVVPYDPDQGWEWADGHVAVRGKACQDLSSGAVLEVQVLAGCKTVVK